SLRFDNELELKEGMVFCVEPGIYIPGVGGFRHSDTVILKKEGTEVVTNYPHDLEDLIK
ncbi:MAG: M24 family metallopeptidase, partial [Staphylococcus simulans]|nr:M24 family metallopeptidase [Staphylococcus simulans]